MYKILLLCMMHFSFLNATPVVTGSITESLELEERSPSPKKRRLSTEDDSNETPPLPILIADDNGVNRRIIGSTLNQLGYTNFVMAENGQQALAIMRRTSYNT